MTRSQFFLSIALLCLSTTLAFFISFREREQRQTSKKLRPLSESRERFSSRHYRPRDLPLSDHHIRSVDRTNYEVSVSNPTLQDLGKKIEADSRKRLQKMTTQYHLSANQRRQIFPLLVSYHAEFQEGLIVNGSTAIAPRRTELASEIYPILNPHQQERYQETLLSDNEWWGDIISQLREDLDQALEVGELDLVTEPIEPLSGFEN